MGADVNALAPMGTDTLGPWQTRSWWPDQDDAHPHIETTDEPGAEAQGGLAMYQGQRS